MYGDGFVGVDFVGDDVDVVVGDVLVDVGDCFVVCVVVM